MNSAIAAGARGIEIGGFSFLTNYDLTVWEPMNDTTSPETNWSFNFDTLDDQPEPTGLSFALTAGVNTMWQAMATSGTQSLVGNSEVLMQGGTEAGAFVFNTMAIGAGAVANIDLPNLTIQGGAAGGAINAAAVNGGTVDIQASKEVLGGESGNAHGIGIGAMGAGSEFTINTGSIKGGNAGSTYGLAYAAQNGGTATVKTTLIQGVNGSAIYAAAISTDGSSTSAKISNFGDFGPGSPILTFQGGDLSYSSGMNVSAYGTGAKSHIESGALRFVGGGAFEAAGLFYNAAQGGTAEITVPDSLAVMGDGIYVKGGTVEDAYGIGYNAYSDGTVEGQTKGTISASGSGKFLRIVGGDADHAHGIGYNASGTGAEGTIEYSGFGDSYIRGGSANADGISYNAYDGGIGSIANHAVEHVLLIKGDVGTGVWANAYGSGSIGTIRNYDTGSLTIWGGAQGQGVYVNASGEGSTGNIVNSGAGQLSFIGAGVAGMYVNSLDLGVGTVLNSGAGTLTIQGEDAGHGIYVNGLDPNSDGSIRNAGSGSLWLLGGTYDGMYANALDGGTGQILNESDGNLTIRGGFAAATIGLRYNAESEGSTATIANLGEGILSIEGGAVADAYGIRYNADEGGTGNIRNEGEGELLIQGGFEAGMYANAGYGGTGTIANSGAGTLTIAAGTGEDAYGIGFNAYSVSSDSTTSGLIVNEGGGTIGIIGGAGKDGFGLSRNATGVQAVGEIANSSDGSLLIQGGSEKKRAGHRI